MGNANLWLTPIENPEPTSPAEPESPAVAARPQPRLKPINRQQSVLRPVDVEQLVEADHPVRAIWELMGRLLPESFWAGIKAVEGIAGQAAFRSPVADQPVGVCLQSTGQFGPRDRAVVRVSSCLSMADRTGDGQLSHSVGFSHP